MTRHSRSNSGQGHYNHAISLSIASPAQPNTSHRQSYSRVMPGTYYNPDPIHGSVPSLPSHPVAQYETYSNAAPLPPLPIVPAPTQHRPSSGAWSPEEDRNLLRARARGLNWGQIQASLFPNKSPNACRKRHERLIERKSSNDWDDRRTEIMASAYMELRKEIWAPVAERTGERWQTVEAKCMSSGIKNLQRAARAGSRRERHEASHYPGYDDDSGIGGIGLTPVEELDAPYSSPETMASGASFQSGTGSSSPPGGYPSSVHQHQGHHQHLAQHQQGHNSAHHSFTQVPVSHYTYAAPSGGDQHAREYQGHGYTSSVSSTGTSASGTYGVPVGQGAVASTSPYMGNGQRQPSADMGIDAIINRTPHGNCS